MSLKQLHHIDIRGIIYLNRDFNFDAGKLAKIVPLYITPQVVHLGNEVRSHFQKMPIG